MKLDDYQWEEIHNDAHNVGTATAPVEVFLPFPSDRIIVTVLTLEPHPSWHKAGRIYHYWRRLITDEVEILNEYLPLSVEKLYYIEPCNTSFIRFLFEPWINEVIIQIEAKVFS